MSSLTYSDKQYAGFEEAPRIFGVVGGDDQQSGDVGVPGGQALRVRGCCGEWWSVASSEGDWAFQLAATHVVQLGRGVHDVVAGLQREVERHELANGSESVKGRADSESCEAVLRDGSVDDSLAAVLLGHVLRNLVGSVEGGNFLAEDEHIRVACHLLVKCCLQAFTDCQLLIYCVQAVELKCLLDL